MDLKGQCSPHCSFPSPHPILNLKNFKKEKDIRIFNKILCACFLILVVTWTKSASNMRSSYIQEKLSYETVLYRISTPLTTCGYHIYDGSIKCEGHSMNGIMGYFCQLERVPPRLAGVSISNLQIKEQTIIGLPTRR